MAAMDVDGVSDPPLPGPGSMAALSEDVSLDALAYIDMEYGTLQEQVKSLVQLEAKQMGPFDEQNYVDRLPPPPTDLKFSSPLLQTEFARVSRHESLPPVDMQRYKVHAPSGESKNRVEGWEQAIGHVRAQLEHQNTRTINLELLKKYGANAWRVHNKRLARMNDILLGQVETNNKASDAINRKRKAEQLTVQPKMHHNTMEWWQFMHKNHQVEAVCQNLEREVKRLKTEAISRGLLKPEPEEPAE